MVHSAYDAVELVAGVPGRIEAVASHAGKLLVAVSDSEGFLRGSDCSLRIYSSPASSPEGGGEIRRDGPYALERHEQRFWRRPPLAMEVSASRDLLLSLSEWVALHRLPGLETVAVVSNKTKGANVFAWDDRRGLLAVGRQKRLTVFRLDSGREFVEVKEFGVPDILKSMAWCGDNICLGIRREYMIINSMTGALTDVFSSGRIAPPLVVPLPTGELLLGKDNIGVFVDQNGKLIQDGRIIWSDTPASVVIHRPYAVARLPRHVEIRSLRAPNALVQTVVLRDVQKLVQTGNCILAALSNNVCGLLPVPIGAQIVQLTASGEFEEALALCKLLPPEDSNLRAAKESSIHIRYGHFLFDSGKYEDAMEQFSNSHVDITYVLSLYPSIVLPQTHIIGEHDKLLDMPELATESSDVTDEMESYSLQLHESDDKSPLEVKKMSHNALVALVKYLQKKRSGIIERATAEVTEEVVSGAVHHSLILSEPYKPKKPNKVQLYLSEVLDWYNILKEEGNWTEKTYSATRKKLISTLENNSGYNTDLLLKRLPQDALFEERAILYGKINQHLRALSLYVHKLQMPERAVAYCDRVYEEGAQQPSKSNIYFNLLQIYLNPRKAEKEFEQKIIPVASQYPGIHKSSSAKFKGGRTGKKVVEIEGADEIRFSPSGTDSGRSDGDGDDANDGGPIMLNEALELLSQRWDRINGAQALRLLPRDTKLQDLVSFLEPLLRNSSEHLRNYLVIKNLIFRANLQVKEDLYKRRQAVVKIDGNSMCSLCHKRIANSAFAIYPNGQTLVHFVCFRESQQIKAVRGANSMRRR
ncbi:hypothetical protein PVAP13_9KG027400 [Panicum virgatum]|uniref:CNH domain-containing protein n=1 Tax=Panicum virgatum TaxID=38727 RepID=A0A8T0NBV3_PANVG|nr:hypothetical protein PVAP13_9KG027400 [Panicum virgatum]